MSKYNPKNINKIIEHLKQNNEVIKEQSDQTLSLVKIIETYKKENDDFRNKIKNLKELEEEEKTDVKELQRHFKIQTILFIILILLLIYLIFLKRKK